MSEFEERNGPPRMRTAHEYVKSMLRDMILEGKLSPGSRLVQSGLATELGVSTTPVREALRDLTAEGLVQMDAHRGAFVRDLDIREVEEIYDLRIMLEPVMIRRTGAVLSREALEGATALHAEMRDETDVQAWVELNRRFHAALSSGDDNSRLSDFLKSLRDSSTPWVRLSLDQQRMQESYEEHSRQLELYRSRDLEALVDVTVEHLSRTLALIQQMASRSDPAA